MVLRTFGWSFGLTLLALAGALWLGGPEALLIVAILIVLEVSLSFDNAVINATVLVRMSPLWQKIFLTIGIAIAVFGMRLVFPLLLVGITASLNPVEVIQLALEGGPVDQEGTYAFLLEEAYPSIAAFGGMFLLILFLEFILEEREHTWLTWIERPLARIGKLDQLAVVLAIGLLVIAAETWAGDNAQTVLVSGLLGAVTYIAVNGLGQLFESQGILAHQDEDAPDPVAKGSSSNGGPTPLVVATGKAAFFLFLYLEVLDASFSFDGVIGAFAISQDIFIIATGLGVGALYIRSLTVYLVRQGTLDDYVYLEHGAHWAIGALAVLLLVTIEYHIPELVTGLIGVGFIVAAFISSVVRNRRLRAGGDTEDTHVHVDARA
ncbi:MAG: DUF475 domain-containing protein [Geodermatophilaceae bacterium]|nr:DUF475 domain-containing protein [Geodermatophilaceae bacterium]